jgi:hypothetical protein
VAVEKELLFERVYRRKRIVYQVGNKNKINYTEIHGQQNKIK